MKTIYRLLILLVTGFVLAPNALSAPQAWDGAFDFDALNQDFLANPLMNQEFTEGFDMEAFFPALVGEAGIDEVAEMKLLEYLLTDSGAPHHQTIYDAFRDTYLIADSRVMNTQAGLIFRKEATKILTALLIRNKALGVLIASDFGINGTNAFQQSELDAMVNVGHLISATGSLGVAGMNNRTAWQVSDLGQPYADRVLYFIELVTGNAVAAVEQTPSQAILVVGQSLQLSASSNVQTDSFTWQSSGPAVTVNSAGLVHAEAEGAAVVTVTGTVSGATAESIITVIPEPWENLSLIQSTLSAQGAGFNGTETDFQLPEEPFDNLDLNEDFVPDAWQVHHLAFVLWQEGIDAEFKKATSPVIDEFQANLLSIASLKDYYDSFLAVLDSLSQEMDYLNVVLQQVPAQSPCFDESGYSQELLDTISAIVGGGPTQDLSGAFLVIQQLYGQRNASLPHVRASMDGKEALLAALGGISPAYTEQLKDILSLNNVDGVLTRVGQLKTMADFLAQCLPTEQDQATAEVISDLASALPALSFPGFAIYGATERPGETPFAGDHDYNGNGISNATIASWVQDAKGTASDYVAGVTGALGMEWLGNPDMSNPEGEVEGEGEGDPLPEGEVEGEGDPLPEGEVEGEGDGEGEGEGEGAIVIDGAHDGDQNGDGIINLSELLRVVQFFNTGGYHCPDVPSQTEDGFAPGLDETRQTCRPHHSDYSPQNWMIGLSELLRLIQFFNVGGYEACPEAGSEDGFCTVER